MPMLDTVAESAAGPMVNSSTPIEMKMTYTFPSRSKATTGSPPAPMSSARNGGCDGPSHVTPPSMET